ncbi:acetamidase/formamidase family protein [Candidatus Aerophobetes bacterium]|nr:acetamidase/formamidase family protein [Candidatus Aerophobetes bacterium]
MKTVSRKEKLNYVLSVDIPPVLRVAQGESFLVETEDNLGGLVRSEEDLPTPENLRPSTDYVPWKHNPLSGPIYVEGAERGDLLTVEIEKIEPAEHGHICTIPGYGPLANFSPWPELAEAYTHIIKHVPGPSGTRRDGKAIYKDNITWGLRPFIGTIGVTPDFESESSLVGQGVWGGNWDCRDIKEGTKLYLPCFHEGALLFLGDVHASQGDGEWSGMANETKAEVVLSCRVIKNKKISYPRLEKKESIIQLYTDKPLEGAVYKAIVNLMRWLVEEYGMTPRDAYFQISTNPDFKINIYQMVDVGRLHYTVGAEFPKTYLRER